MQLLGAFIVIATAGQLGVEAEAPRAPGDQMVELGVSTGLFIPASDHELYDSLGTDHRQFAAVSPSVTLRLSYFPWRYVGVESEGAYMPARTSNDELSHLFGVRGHGVLQWPWRLTPFLLAGGGILGSSGASGGDVDEAFHWGLGAKFYASDWLSVRLDGRQIYTAGRGPGAGNTSHFEVLAGVSVTLYRAEPADDWTVADVGSQPQPAPPPAPAPASKPERDGEPEPVARSIEVATSTPAIVLRRALDSVHFAFGSAALGPNTHAALDLAADVLRRNPSMRLRIVGHTDHIGTEAYNQGLSERRAQSVKRYLMAAGIDASRIECAGMGERAPVAPNDSARGRARNRRSEFNVDLIEGRSSAGPSGEP